MLRVGGRDVAVLGFILTVIGVADRKGVASFSFFHLFLSFILTFIGNTVIKVLFVLIGKSSLLIIMDVIIRQKRLVVCFHNE